MPYNYKTRQDIFNEAYTGLAKQGFFRSVGEIDVISDVCKYRGRHGLKCAIGHCIPDANYEKSFDNGVSFLKVLEAANIHPVDDTGFAYDLQREHDTGVSPENMQKNLAEFATRFNLTIPQV